MKVETFQYEESTGWGKLPAHQTETGTNQELLIVFGAPGYFDQSTPFAQLSAHFPDATMVGCSTSGEIFGESLHDKSLSVAWLQMEQPTSKIRQSVVAVPSMEASFEVGQTLAKELLADDLRGIFVLSDGLMVNGSELVRGINAVVPESVVVTGGLAGDGPDFGRTWVLKDKRPHTGHVSAVGLYGEHLHLGHGSKGGWDIFGLEKVITKSDNNVLYEINNKPALAMYKSYLGDRADELPASGLLFPLALKQGDKTLVRTILSVDEEAQSLTFAGDVPEGTKVQMMKANFDRLVRGAEDAAETISERDLASLADNPLLLLAVSCVGRRLVLGERTEDELDAVLGTFPQGTKQIGFYSYGEICPFNTGHCDLHNQTMTVTALYETNEL